MSTRAYQRSVRLRESEDGPWLDEDTTAPYVPWSARTNTLSPAAESFDDARETTKRVRRISHAPQPQAAPRRASVWMPSIPPLATRRRALPPPPPASRKQRIAAAAQRLRRMPMTAEQVSNAALESFWRDTERTELRVRRARVLTLSASAVLVCLMLLFVFGQDFLPGAFRRSHFDARVAQVVKLVEGLAP